MALQLNELYLKGPFKALSYTKPVTHAAMPCTTYAQTHARPSLPVNIFPIRPHLTEGHMDYMIPLLYIDA